MKVFISYAFHRDTAGEKTDNRTHDREVAEKICRRLESEGIGCWMAPRDITPGDSWVEAIIDGVDRSRVMILVFSAAANRSQWVKDEITLALERHLKIIPFGIEDVSPQGTLKILRARSQWIDASTPPLEKHLDRLALAVRTHLDRESKKQPPPEKEAPQPTPPPIQASQKQSQPKEEVSKKPPPSRAPLKKKRRIKPLKWITLAASVIALIVIAYLLRYLITPKHEEKPPPITIEDPVKKQLEEPQGKKSPAEKKAEPEKKEDRSALNKDSQKGIPPNLKAVEARAKVKIIKNIDGEDLYEADFGSGIIMVYIPPGKFKMGSNEGEDNEKPPHDVDLDGYWMGKTEVTFDQYDRFCEATDRKQPGDEGWGRGQRPVINVSWNDADAYCRWLSGEVGLEFKLPSEAQWEKAARGSDGRKYPWWNSMPAGDKVNFADKQLGLEKDYSWIDRNIDDGFAYTAPVGSFPSGASPYGLLDMAGNVWEWCADWYDGEYYKNSPPKNPGGPSSGSYRVIRGGGWGYSAEYLRCAFRYYIRPSNRYFGTGLRLCQKVK